MANRFLRAFFLLVTAVFFVQHPVEGWWAGGHLTVADIAYELLEPEVREKVDALSAEMGDIYPNHTTFVTSATWPADLSIKAFARWHYTNNPFDPEGVLSPKDVDLIRAQHSNNDVVWLVKMASGALARDDLPAFEKAFMLKFLIHCVADIHQPLHCCSRHSVALPGGDYGGNLFRVAGMTVPNLHLLWDSGLGAIPVVMAPPEMAPPRADELAAIHEFAQEIVARYAPDSDVVACQRPERWAAESHRLACTVVYAMEENSTPSEEYIVHGQRLCHQRLVLAAYRLAYLLNQVLGN